MKTPLLLSVLCISLFGCATQATRENLRNCQWEVASVKMDTHTPQSYQGSATVRIRNVSKKTAILDSLWIDVATPGGPLAHLSHGRTLEVAAGGSDSAVIHFQAVPAQLGQRMMEMLFASPDSLSIKGQARVPLLWGMTHSNRPFQFKVPAAPILSTLSKMTMGARNQAPLPEATGSHTDTSSIDEP